MIFSEPRPNVFVTADIPNASIFKLKWGGWRFQLGGVESSTFGQRENAERALIVQATERTPFGAKL